MLSKETREEAIQFLLTCRYAYINDFTRDECAYGIEGFKPVDEMTDKEIISECEGAYNIIDEDLYDCMIAEMEAHKMLTPTVSIDL